MIIELSKDYKYRIFGMMFPSFTNKMSEEEIHRMMSYYTDQVCETSNFIIDDLKMIIDTHEIKVSIDLFNFIDTIRKRIFSLPTWFSKKSSLMKSYFYATNCDRMIIYIVGNNIPVTDYQFYFEDNKLRLILSLKPTSINNLKLKYFHTLNHVFPNKEPNV